jgi:hypothetical protein
MHGKAGVVALFFLSWVNGFYEANCNDGTSERRSMTDVREDF